MRADRPRLRSVIVRVTAVLVAAVLVAPVHASATPTSVSQSWLRSPAMIAHGMGGLTIRGSDGVERVYTYTNSLEAFEQNYAKGYRIFEVDMLLTSDKKLVARHSWSRSAFGSLGQSYPGHVPSRAEFLATPIHGSYTPLDVEGIARIMRAHPDVYIVTDTKASDGATIRAQIGALRSQLGSDRNALSQRIIVQVYSEGMYRVVRDVYPFPNVIYTLYMLRTTPERAAAFAKANGIRVIVCLESRWTSSFRARCKAMGLAVGIHTVNSPAVAARVFGRGARFVYSDALSGDVDEAVKPLDEPPAVVQSMRLSGVW